MDIIVPLYATPKTTPRLQPLVDAAFGTIAMHASNIDRSTVVRALFSGGKDSMVTAHISSHLPEFRGLGHVRTMTGPVADRHSDRALEIAAKQDWHVITRSPSETLAALVAQFGLPGPAAHTWMYIHLKERAIRKITSAARKAKQRIVYTAGMRAAESAKRAANSKELTEVTQTEWWINPILDWSDEDVLEYIAFHGLSVPSIGHSLDCFCGSYATPEEREWIQIEHPGQYEYILLLEAIARAGHQIQVLEVKSGHREVAFPVEFCAWGHGLNKADVRANCTSKTNLCVNCDGKAYKAS